MGALVGVEPFQDPDGNPVTINITGVAANRVGATVCRCSAASRRSGACRCMPDASIGTIDYVSRAFIMPLPRALDATTRREVPTAVRVTFDAIVPATGLSCSGAVHLCAARGAAQGRKPAPVCADFDSTGATRDLTVCKMD